MMLHSVFKRALRDRVILHNPCLETELPKVVPNRLRILTPAEFDRLLRALPERHTAMLLTEIETGLRWGELIALRSCDVDFLGSCQRLPLVRLGADNSDADLLEDNGLVGRERLRCPGDVEGRGGLRLAEARARRQCG